MTEGRQVIPALVNVASGSADAARKALDANPAFEVHAVQPGEIEAEVTAMVAAGSPRILVAGGDGTIATAAAVLMKNPAELSILPGGTLNHFARDLGIATDSTVALEQAVAPETRGVDVGTVGGRIFLNTSSVGAYVHFVRAREYFEKHFGYRVASAVAALRVLFQFRLLGVELEVDGTKRLYRTPVVFIGVGERELQLPTLGSRVTGGRRGLHVLVVRGRSRARLFAIGMSAVARGVKATARTPELDSFLVDRCTITTRRRLTVAVDGELVTLSPPFEYTLVRDALTVVCPPTAPVASAPHDGERPSGS